MRIRAGFVSNSSSTSFLIISKEELNEGDFLELMGLQEGSPLAPLFRAFFRDLVDSISGELDLSSAPGGFRPELWMESEHVRPTEHMLAKLRALEGTPAHVYVGMLSSDNNMVESFFCTDSFELENEKIYFNGLECVW